MADTPADPRRSDLVLAIEYPDDGEPVVTFGPAWIGPRHPDAIFIRRDTTVDLRFAACLWCGEPTDPDGRQVVETRLGVGTVVKGRLCPSCSADAGDLEDEARC